MPDLPPISTPPTVPGGRTEPEGTQTRGFWGTLTDVLFGRPGLAGGRMGRFPGVIPILEGTARGYGAFQQLTGRGQYDPLEALRDPATVNRYLDSVYPGTTPWERLGSEPATAAGASGKAAAGQNKLFKMQLAQRDVESKRQLMAQLNGQELSALSSLTKEIVSKAPEERHNMMRMLLQHMRSPLANIVGQDIPSSIWLPRIDQETAADRHNIERLGMRIREVANEINKGYLDIEQRRSLLNHYDRLIKTYDSITDRYNALTKRMDFGRMEQETQARVGLMGAQETKAISDAQINRFLADLKAEIDRGSLDTQRWKAKFGQSLVAQEFRGLAQLMFDWDSGNTRHLDDSGVRGYAAAMLLGALTAKFGGTAGRALYKIVNRSRAFQRFRRLLPGGPRKGSFNEYLQRNPARTPKERAKRMQEFLEKHHK